ncbi:protein of unknown function [Microbacterium sp. Nx66]|nr:protein of unknown function [Microbacterium sp. Nx66]
MVDPEKRFSAGLAQNRFLWFT